MIKHLGATVVWLFIAWSLACSRASATDNEKTWYVNDATGNDSNTGHTPTTAKKTMTAALAASVEGDTFYIAPGVYSSTSSLNAKSGQTWIGSGWTTVLQRTGSGVLSVVALTNVSCVTIENLKLEHTGGGGQGIRSIGCQACLLKRVWTEGSQDGARLDAFDCGIIDQCKATSDYDAWVINGLCTTVQNTIGETTATRAGDPMCCFRTGVDASAGSNVHISFVNCQAYSIRTEANTNPIEGWEVNGACAVLLENSGALVRSTATGSAQMRGISAKDSAVCVLSGNVAARTENSGTGGAVDLKRADSALLRADPTTTRFVITDGTITVRIPNVTPGTTGGLPVVP